MPGRPTNEPSNYFAFGKQTAKDTEATTFQFARHLDGTGAEFDEQVAAEREGGDGQEVGLRYKTGLTFDGALVQNARPEVLARTAAWTFGADSAQGPQGVGSTASGIANEHLAVPTSTIPYVTVDQYWADEVERGPNVQFTGFTVEGAQGRPLKLTHAFIAGGTSYRRDVASIMTPTRETGAPFFFPGASYQVDGAANTKITKFKLDVKRNVDDQIRTTGLNREDVVALNFDTSLEMTLKFESATGIYEKTHYVVGGSQVPIDLATGTFKLYQVFGSGTNIRYTEMGLNQFHYTGARVNKLDPDGKTMYIDVTAEGYKAATGQVYVRSLIASTAAL